MDSMIFNEMTMLYTDYKRRGDWRIPSCFDIRDSVTDAAEQSMWRRLRNVTKPEGPHNTLRSDVMHVTVVFWTGGARRYTCCSRARRVSTPMDRTKKGRISLISIEQRFGS